MPKKLTVTTYSFDELSEAAQEKALQENWEINTCFPWWEVTIDGWKAKLKEMGYNDAEIEYEGDVGQHSGGGASFTATVDIAVWLRNHRLGNKFRAVLNKADELQFEIVRPSQHHINSASIISWLESPRFTSLAGYLKEPVAEILNLMQKEARELSRQIFNELEREYAELTSKEAIIGTFQANECRFTKDGGSKVYI